MFTVHILQSPFPPAGDPPPSPVTGPGRTAWTGSSLARYHSHSRSQITISWNVSKPGPAQLSSTISWLAGQIRHSSSHSSFYSIQILQVGFGSADTFFWQRDRQTHTQPPSQSVCLSGLAEAVYYYVLLLSCGTEITREYEAFRSPSSQSTIEDFQ